MAVCRASTRFGRMVACSGVGHVPPCCLATAPLHVLPPAAVCNTPTNERNIGTTDVLQTIGNHELDFGPANLAGECAGTAAADAAVMCPSLLAEPFEAPALQSMKNQ